MAILRGFLIADFTDQDHVRVLSQHRAQHAGKGHFNFRALI